MSVHIKHGFNEADRAKVVDLYWQAFGPKLGTVMSPEQKALAFLRKVADPSHAISAVDHDGTLLGVAGFKTAKGALIGGSLKDMAQIYGWFGALWRGLTLSVLERAPEPDILTMDGIFVSPEARGQGVGTLLLTAIKDEAKRQGLTSVRLDVIDINPRAKALYEREGFKDIGREDTGPFKHLFGFSSATKMLFTHPKD